MSKLRLLGIEGNISRWIKAFLSVQTQRVCVDGHLSTKADVKSGVPQALQWGMRFNTDKCHILTVSASAQPLSKLYEIDGSFLQHVDTATYLGIIIHRTLEFADHITEAVSKANKKLGFLKRNLKGCPSELKKTAYISLIRSGLEYGATIWDPHLETQKKAIEQVQNRAIRWCQGLSPHQQCSITQLRKELQLRTLEERRLQQRLTLLFKIVHGVVVVAPEDLGLEAADGRTRSSHRHKYKEKRARTNRLKFSPVYRSIPTWNRLPASVAEAGSVDTFKSRLSALRP